ncbi:MAG: type II toxin-antitoxin system RelE/ParE family toxin [Dongiaceae bacterium]
MWSVVYSAGAAKTLARMPRNTADLIRRKILALAHDPYAINRNVKALVGRPGYRLRVGDWRVIYELHSHRLVVQVLTIAPRESAYR